ncbi:MAG: TonB-dependent receptor, partial [Spirochaetia bacterium]|nr:TonB-dependent receptor [Spirochaetia bacterium]
MNPVGYRVSADSSRGGRIRTPNGSLPNTGFLEENANATIGADGAWGNWYLDAFHRELRQDLLDNPNEDRAARPGAQNVHDKWHFHGFLIFPFFKLETDISSQRNNRREIPDKNVYYPIRGLLIDPNNNDFTKGVAIYQVTALPKKQGLNLELDTTTADVKVHHDPVFGLLKGTLGAAGVTQRNVTIGSEQLIPAYHLWSASLFAYEEVDLKNVVFSGGARIDRRAFDVSANTALGVTDQTRNFESKTASTGMVWRISKPFAVALNYGSGFRSPTPFELFANGVHEGTGKFEIGNRNLKPEVSKDIDLSFRFITRNVKAELTFFRNSIQDFIYSVSTGQVDGESGLTKYVYRQDPALLQGGELSLEAALLKWLVFQGGADVVRGTVEKRYDPANALNPDKAAQARIISELYTGGVSTPLPRVPADRLRLGFKLTSSSLGPLSKPYFSIAGRFIASQDRIDVLETRTPGYTLLDIGAGFEIPSLSNATDKATFDVAVLNATNEKYTD